MVFPTETVYGLGAHALSQAATDRIFEAKGRPSTDPLIVHVADIAAARKLSLTWSDEAERLAQRFWPGPLTLVVPKAPVVPDSVTADRPTVALRIPAHPVALGLLRAAGVPVAAPSANRFGRISPTSAADVEAELAGRYDLLLDAGPTAVGVESTVLDLTGEIPTLLRPGGVTIEELEAVVGKVCVLSRQVTGERTGAAAPGQFLRHYAPRTPLVAVDGTEHLVTELVTALDAAGIAARVLELPVEPAAAARVLYSTLRAADGTAELLVVRLLGSSGIGAAVDDRLYRAAEGRVVTSADDAVVGRLSQLVCGGARAGVGEGAGDSAGSG